MRGTLVSLLGIAVLIGAIWLPVGCISVGGGNYNFIKMMTCPGTPVERDGDLAFFNLTAQLLTSQPTPGDLLAMEFTVGNMTPQGSGANANIGMPSNMRLFFSFDNRIGPEDYLAGEFPVSGIAAGSSQTYLYNIQIPRVTAPPAIADVTLGTGNLNNGEITPNFAITPDVLQQFDWLLVQSPAPQSIEYFMRVTGINGGVIEVEGIHPAGPVINNATLIRTERPKYFPFVITSVGSQQDPDFNERDPSRPEYIGPQSIAYNVICVLDSQNCVIEAGEPTTPEFERYDPNDPSDGAEEFRGLYDAGDPEMNNQAIADRLIIMNPNLPNLTIRFLDRQPSADLPQLGSIVNTRWEVRNDGISPVTMPFLVRTYFSETESYSTWDSHVSEINWPMPLTEPLHRTQPLPMMPPLSDVADPVDPYRFGFWQVETPVPGSSNIAEIIRARFPYWNFRSNVYTQNDVSPLFLWIGPGVSLAYVSRVPPPDNVPGWWFEIRLPIPTEGGTTNYLIAEVDCEDPYYNDFVAGTTPDPYNKQGFLDRIRESNEFDNYSHNVQNGNGQLTVGYQNDVAPLNMRAVDLLANYDTQNARMYLSLRYDNEHSGGECTIGWYLSQNDTAQSSDFMWQRFWYTLQQGQGITLSTSYTMGPELPVTGPWYVGGVLDDVFRYQKRLNNDNHTISAGYTTIW